MVISWESIVSIIKRSLKLVLKDPSGHEEWLKTFFVSLEFTVNSLQLLPLRDDHSGLDPLTLNRSFIGTQSLYLNSNIKFDKIDSKLR